MITIICKECGKEFQNYPSNNRSFCSRKCFAIGSNKIIICRICGKEFKRNRREQKYCSNKCGIESRIVLPKSCKICGKKFKKHSGSFLCSKECRAIWITKKIKSICEICGNEFEHKRSRDRKYCSQECHAEGRRLIKGLQLIDGKAELKCFQCGESVYRFPCQVKMYENFYCSKCRPINNDHSEINKLRSSKKYKEWRKSIFERDGYACRICYKTDCYIEAHHIIPVSTDIKSALNLNNGEILCLECHSAIHGINFKRVWVEKSKINEKKFNVFRAQNGE